MDRTRKPPLPSRTKRFARQLRSQPTDAERNLWYHLRAGRMQGLKWRRQHPVPPYIVDFYCPRLQLAIELDGGQHSAASDAAREAWLDRQGIAVLRFWDHQVLLEMEHVLEAVWSAVLTRTHSPNPSPGGRGEQEPEPHQ